MFNKHPFSILTLKYCCLFPAISLPPPLACSKGGVLLQVRAGGYIAAAGCFAGFSDSGRKLCLCLVKRDCLKAELFLYFCPQE